MADTVRTEGRPAPPPKPTARTPGTRPKVAPRVAAKPQPPVPQRPSAANKPAPPGSTANGLPNTKGEPVTSKVAPPLPSLPPCASKRSASPHGITPLSRSSTPTDRSDNDSPHSSRNASPVPESNTDPPTPKRPGMAGMVRVLPMDIVLANAKAKAPIDAIDSTAEKNDDLEVSASETSSKGGKIETQTTDASRDGRQPGEISETRAENEPVYEPEAVENDVSKTVVTETPTVENVPAEVSSIPQGLHVTSNSRESSPVLQRHQAMEGRRSESPIPPNTVLISGLKPEDLRKDSKKPVKPKPMAKPNIKPKPGRNASQFYIGLSGNSNSRHVENGSVPPVKDSGTKAPKTKSKSFDLLASEPAAKSVFHKSFDSELVSQPSTETESPGNAESKQQNTVQEVQGKETENVKKSDTTDTQEVLATAMEDSENPDTKVSDVVENVLGVSAGTDNLEQNVKKTDNIPDKVNEDKLASEDQPKKPPRRKKTLRNISQKSSQSQSFEEVLSTPKAQVEGKKIAENSKKSSPKRELKKQENVESESQVIDGKLKRVPSRKAPPPPPRIVAAEIDIESQNNEDCSGKSGNKKSETQKQMHEQEGATAKGVENSKEESPAKKGRTFSEGESAVGGSIHNLAASMSESISKGLQHQLTCKTKPKPIVKPKPKPPLLKPRPKIEKTNFEGPTKEEDGNKTNQNMSESGNLKVKKDGKYGRNSSYSKALDEDNENENVEKGNSLRRDSYSRALDDEEEVEGERSVEQTDMEEKKKPVIPGMVRVLPIDLKQSKVNIKFDNENDKASESTSENSQGEMIGSVDNNTESKSGSLRNTPAVFVPPPPPETETKTKMLQYPSVDDEQNNRLSQQVPLEMLDDQVFKSGQESEERGEEEEVEGGDGTTEDDDGYYEDVEVRKDLDEELDGETENIYEPPPDLPPKNNSSTPPIRPPKRPIRQPPRQSPPPVPIQSPPSSPMKIHTPQALGTPPLPPRTFKATPNSPQEDTSRRSPSEMYDAEGYLEPVRQVPADDVYSYADLPEEYPFDNSSPQILRKKPEIGSPPKEILDQRASNMSIVSVRTSGGSHIYEPIVSRPGSITEHKDSNTEHRISGNSIFYYGIDENQVGNKEGTKNTKGDTKEKKTAVARRPVTLDTPIPVPRAPPRTKRRKTAVPVTAAKKVGSDSDSSDSDYIYPDDPGFIKPQDSVYLKEEVKDTEESEGLVKDTDEAIYHEADDPAETDNSEEIYNEADESVLDTTSGSSITSPDTAPPIPPRDHHRSEPTPQAIKRALEIQRSTSTVSDSKLLLKAPKSIPKTVSFESQMDSGLSLSPSGDEYLKSPESEEAGASPRPKLRSISISSPNIGLNKRDHRGSEDANNGRPSSWASSADGYEDPRDLRSASLRKMAIEDQESVISDLHPPGMNTSHGSGSSINTDSSDSDDEELARERAEKRKRKLTYIAREMMTSEATFVDVLRLLNIDFRQTIDSATASRDHPVVPAGVMNQILQYLPQLQNFNEELLQDLKQRLDNWSSNPRVADIFVRKGPFLKMYTFYIREFENSMVALDEARKKYAEFDTAVKDFEASPKCKNLFIKHFMLKPIQRIPQYKLLLQDYQKYLRQDHPDYKDTKTALAIVSEVADHANESMKYGDNFKKLWEIQSSLIGHFEVIKPGREFLKEGLLHKLSRKVMQPRMFFLFSDVMLYTTPVSGGYKLNNDIPLTGMRVSKPSKEDFQNELSILSTQRSFTISASTPEERDEWLTDLQEAIKENAKRRSSFDVRKLQNMSSVVGEVERDFKLGQRAPVWVPDARVSMCMLCTAEFSVTFRRHHCRACGKVVCGFCSDYRAPIRYLTYKAARVCIECYHKLSKEFDENDEPSDLSSSFEGDRDGSFSKVNLKSKFRGISWGSYRKANKAKRPAVLQEVSANDEAAEMSGYLKVWRNKKWKKLWFVLKGKIFYTYKASEDTAATESTVLLGYEVTTFNSWFEGVEPSLVFELSHKGTSPMVFRTESSSSRDKWLQAMQSATIP